MKLRITIPFAWIKGIILFLIGSSACFVESKNSGHQVIGSVTPTPERIQVKMTERGLVNENGWDVPPFGPLITKKIGKVTYPSNSGDFFEIDYELRVPSSELIVPEPTVLYRSDEKFVRIESVTALSFSQKTFAYSFVADRTRFPNQGDSLEHRDSDKIAAKMAYMYVDNDGDGLFEWLKADSQPFFIPIWVLR